MLQSIVAVPIAECRADLIAPPSYTLLRSIRAAHPANPKTLAEAEPFMLYPKTRTINRNNPLIEYQQAALDHRIIRAFRNPGFVEDDGCSKEEKVIVVKDGGTEVG